MEILFWGLGAIGFWVFFGVICLILIALVEHERIGWSTLLLIGTLLFFQLGTSFKPFSLLSAHPVWGALTVLGYFVAGAAWCIWKWWFFVKAKRREYDEKKRRFLEANGVGHLRTVPENLRDTWRDMNQLPYDTPKPMPSRHKGRIMTWLVYWPWSFVWTIIDDPIKRMFRAIYDQIKSTLEAISHRAFRDVDDELAPPSGPSGGPSGNPRHGRSRPYRGQTVGYDEEDDEDVAVVEHGDQRLETLEEAAAAEGGRPAPDIAHSGRGFVLDEDEAAAGESSRQRSQTVGQYDDGD